MSPELMGVAASDGQGGSIPSGSEGPPGLGSPSRGKSYRWEHKRPETSGSHDRVWTHGGSARWEFPVYARRPLNELELLFCRKCGLAQENLDSMVCERCGADLGRPHPARSSSRRPFLLLRRALRTPAQLINRGFTALLLLLSLIIRSVMLLVVLASLAIGFSLVPEVNARVPATKEVAATAEQWLQRAEAWSGTLMAYWQTVVHPSQRPSQPTANPQPPAAGQFVAPQALQINSTPGGATVRIGTRTVGKTPMTLRVAPGTYTVTISRPGYAPVTRTISVKHGKAASLGVTLDRAGRATAPPSPTPKGRGHSKQPEDKIPPGQDDDEP